MVTRITYAHLFALSSPSRKRRGKSEKRAKIRIFSKFSLILLHSLVLICESESTVMKVLFEKNFCLKKGFIMKMWGRPWFVNHKLSGDDSILTFYHQGKEKLSENVSF